MLTFATAMLSSELHVLSPLIPFDKIRSKRFTFTLASVHTNNQFSLTFKLLSLLLWEIKCAFMPELKFLSNFFENLLLLLALAIIINVN